MIDAIGQLSHVNEVLHADEQAKFVENLVPWALDIIEKTPVSMVASSNGHRIRHGILAVLKTVASMTEPMKPFLDKLTTTLMSVLEADNEENAIVAIHVLIDLQKIHRSSLDTYAQGIIDYVLGTFERFSETCEAVFEVPLPALQLFSL